MGTRRKKIELTSVVSILIGAEGLDRSCTDCEVKATGQP